MSRSDLARRQAELLQALLADGPPPAGFDPARLRVEARVLRRKHGRVLAYQRPEVAEALGERYGPLFAEFSSGRPKKATERSGAYADEFVRWLTERGHLPKPRRRLADRLRRR
ncbi:hypothetical protein [Amycolatopsis vancoresmycina]|uniref:SCO6045-like C-terminal domain-containing protein n=1 Tax=Amycolatopsis vancoresmycina DSM 44592 TaxID=1292037 RepID=R1HEE9_9PSEU|nr:hypothetical protein [Amycolatopsis vancoresmycina]EOD58811.1 hypothetical protein H480_42500 [Amycolatopsis vancoresmycina DSM 44592]